MADDQETAVADISAETHQSSENGTTGLEQEPRCVGPGCTKTLPGRSSRAKYCSDACRAAAHRARTITHAAPVANALLRAQDLLTPLLAAGQQWRSAQDALRDQLDELNAGALAQVEAAEQAAEEARAAAASAEQRAVVAANTASTQIVAAEQTRTQAEAARDRAEEREQDAWRQVGEHLRARTQAEQGAADAAAQQRQAETERDAARQQSAELTERHTAASARITALQDESADRQRDILALRHQLQAQQERAHAAEQERDQAVGTAAAHAQEIERLRQALSAEQQRREQAATAAAVAEQARTAAEQATATAIAEAERIRAEAVDLTAAIAAERRQREHAETAAAVARALLHQQIATRPADAPDPATDRHEHSADETGHTRSARPRADVPTAFTEQRGSTRPG